MRASELLTKRPPGTLTDCAVLLSRLSLAVVFFAHGLDALRNLGVSGVVEMQRESGIPLPEIAGPFTVYVELIGGPLLALGGLTRLVAMALAGLMLGALSFIHVSYGIFVENGGFELVLVLAVACVVLAVTGPGRYSVDALVSRLGPRAPVAERVRV
ncbi:putative oxidoreductase [Amycolatopsis marina]|uniref:Putative oxidoreductase n=1 Tax=Amycolatopsis marina TaxID=490629 RepID=A0A1I1BI32_9PSEU|nr:DoxX family protein [Amycolatopsis marina]SFB48438.1 putative oxidoreductase [Amycolatopsis marina]